MIFKELLKERVKRNIRLKSDKQEMPISINRQIDSTPKPYVFLLFLSILYKIKFHRKPPPAIIKLQPKAIAPSGTNVCVLSYLIYYDIYFLGSTRFFC